MNHLTGDSFSGIVLLLIKKERKKKRKKERKKEGKRES